VLFAPIEQLNITKYVPAGGVPVIEDESATSVAEVVVKGAVPSIWIVVKETALVIVPAPLVVLCP
jgi:hypothetical protein